MFQEHCETMHLNKILLHQAAEVLQYADRARRGVIKATKEDSPSEHAEAAYVVLKDIASTYGAELSLAVPITRLYAAHYATQAHRIDRVTTLLRDCYTTHCKVQDALFNEHLFWSAGETNLARAHFGGAADMLYLAWKALEAVAAPCQSNQLEAVEAKREVQALDHAHSHSPDKSFTPIDYFRPRFIYERPPLAQCITDELTIDEINAVLVEKIGVAFERIETGGDYKHGRWAFQSVNAVWESSMAPLLNQDSGKATYLKALHSLGGDDAPNPVKLAKVMRTLGIQVGIIFPEDISVVIWPFRESLSKDVMRVVVYCNKEFSYHRYYTVRLLEPGVKAVPKITNRRRLSCFQRETELKIEPSNSDVFTTVPGPSSKSFPLLRLPAELRNKVYASYISDLGLPSSRHGRFTRYRDVKIPELAQTCRQLRNEVLSFSLASRPLELHIDSRELKRLEFRFVKDHILRHQNWPLVSLSAAASFIDIQVFVGDDCDKYAFRLRKSGGETSLDVSDTWQKQYLPKLAVQYEQLKRLVAVVLEDSTSYGLSLIDVAVITEVVVNICHKRR